MNITKLTMEIEVLQLGIYSFTIEMYCQKFRFERDLIEWKKNMEPLEVLFLLYRYTSLTTTVFTGIQGRLLV